MTDCVFCKIVSGQIPSSKVYEDSQILAFMDAGQVNPGHVIVAVKPHVKNIYGLNADLAAAVFRAASQVAKAVKTSMQPAGMTLLQANEKAGWQTVEHFHIHVLPRYLEDGVTFTWPVKNPPRAELDRLADRVKGGLG
ncbi:MAG: HIT family protein [Hyphomicrobiales bacterium]